MRKPEPPKLEIRPQGNKRALRFLPFALVLSVVLSISFPGCILKKNACEYCPAKDSVSVKSDSSAEEITHQPDSQLVPFYVEGPIRYLPSPCENLCDSMGKLKPIDVKSSKNGLSSHIYSKGDTLVNECNADSILRVSQLKERKIRIRDEIIRILTREVIRPKPQTWFDRAKTASFYILGTSLLILLILAFFYARSRILTKVRELRYKKPG